MERLVTTCDLKGCGKELTLGDGGTLPGVCVGTWFYGKDSTRPKIHHFCSWEHMMEEFNRRLEERNAYATH